EMMRRSDWLVDMGPGAGLHGGEVVAEGPAGKVERVGKSVTGQFLSGKRSIAVPERREEDRGSFLVRGAAQHNLKEIDVEFPGCKPWRFSFNVRGGRCETCKGDGQIKIEMHFLPDVYVPCETCKGARYNRETLEVRFKGKSIADVLEMSVEEALRFFAKIPKIRRRLQTLHDVGLDYIKLGQPATTL